LKVLRTDNCGAGVSGGDGGGKGDTNAVEPTCNHTHSLRAIVWPGQWCLSGRGHGVTGKFSHPSEATAL